MKKVLNDDKRKTISITIDKNLNNLIEEKTSNKSRYISWLLIEKLNNMGVDVSKIKL